MQSKKIMIKISVLEKAVIVILSSLKEQSIESIDSPVDYYWSIPPDKRFDVYTHPTDFTIGQISEDWGWLEEIAQGTKKPTTQSLVWLASVLECLSYSASNQNSLNVRFFEDVDARANREDR
jgi:hypothetical protein